MISGQLHVFKRALLFALVLTGISSLSVSAGPLIDLDKKLPLGAISINATGEKVFFSLGNGRAIQVPTAGIKSADRGGEYFSLQKEDLLFKSADKAIKIRPVKRRNIKW